jgi:hypothetical protein
MHSTLSHLQLYLCVCVKGRLRLREWKITNGRSEDITADWTLDNFLC